MRIINHTGIAVDYSRLSSSVGSGVIAPNHIVDLDVPPGRYSFALTPREHAFVLNEVEGSATVEIAVTTRNP
jgi:hypothetical protein